MFLCLSSDSFIVLLIISYYKHPIPLSIFCEILSISFIDNLELTGFTFGDITPSLRCVKAFECSDGVPGFKPASWSSICQPPVGLEKLSAYRVVLEADMASRCEDFRMVFQARVGSKK